MTHGEVFEYGLPNVFKDISLNNKFKNNSVF